MNNDDLVERDLRVLWHPCSQMKDHESLPMVPIRKGKGVWLEDFDGRRYLDAVSSWWVNLFGHSNPVINAAITEQLDRLEHVILAGFSHEPVVRLSERLVDMTPPGLTRCFFADNGSSAVEVSLKMSFHYWRNCGRSGKTKFIKLSNSYHGETLGALSVGDVALYKDTYGPLLMDTITVRSPDCFHREAGQTWAEHSLTCFAEMEEVLRSRGDEVSAVIVEPLIQCAGEMRIEHRDLRGWLDFLGNRELVAQRRRRKVRGVDEMQGRIERAGQTARPGERGAGGLGEIDGNDDRPNRGHGVLPRTAGDSTPTPVGEQDACQPTGAGGAPRAGRCDSGSRAVTARPSAL